jgi:sulfur transfer protein SufE
MNNFGQNNGGQGQSLRSRYDLRILIPVIILCVGIVIALLSLFHKSDPGQYHFQALTDSRIPRGHLLGLAPSALEQAALSDGDLIAYGKYTAAFRGSTLSLFGQPLPNERHEQDDYIIQATDADGRVWIVTVYQGLGEVGFGGDSSDDTIMPVAEALRDLIEQTTPADFDDTFYSPGYDSTIHYGCKDGQCYYQQQPGNQLPPTHPGATV